MESNGEVDRKYLEDQFYLGLTYNFATNLPAGISQRNLSYGLQAGFIKDIPLSYQRNMGIAIGLGYGINSYYTNLLASQQGSDVEYTVLDSDVDFSLDGVIQLQRNISFGGYTPVLSLVMFLMVGPSMYQARRK